MFNHFISPGAANTNIPLAILANYWRRRISVCLQNGVKGVSEKPVVATSESLGERLVHSPGRGIIE